MLAPKPLNGLLVAAAVQEASGCELAPKPLNMLVAGPGVLVAAPCVLAPRKLKPFDGAGVLPDGPGVPPMLWNRLPAGAAVLAASCCVLIPNPEKEVLAGVVEVVALFWAAELMLPKRTGFGAGVLSCAADAVGAKPNRLFAGADEEGADARLEKRLLEGAVVVATLLGALELRPPKRLVWGAALVPKRVLGAAVVEVLSFSPPKGVLPGFGWEGGILNIDAVKPEFPEPFIVGAGMGAPKALFVAAVKLKPVEGGCGWKPVVWPPPPKAGNDEVVKVLLAVDDWVGGKLLVASFPKSPPFGVDCCCDCDRKPNGFALTVLSPPKPKPDAWGGPKLGVAESPCSRALAPACCCCRRRCSRRHSTVYLIDMSGGNRRLGGRRQGDTYGGCARRSTRAFGSLDSARQRVSRVCEQCALTGAELGTRSKRRRTHFRVAIWAAVAFFGVSIGPSSLSSYGFSGLPCPKIEVRFDILRWVVLACGQRWSRVLVPKTCKGSGVALLGPVRDVVSKQPGARATASDSLSPPMTYLLRVVK